MLKTPRYSHHSLTGKLVHHGHTSYALLLFLVLGVGLLVASVASSAEAGSSCGGANVTTCGSSFTVNAAVPPPRPSTAAIITSPVAGQTFNTNPITVEGTCQAGSIIKVFSNDIMVGSVICGANRRFSLPVHLVIGRNELKALPFNTIDQQGPDGNTVAVTLNQPPGGPGFSTELVLQSSSYYRGVKPGDEVVWPLEIVGGTAPYAVSVDWGDGKTDLVTRLAPGPFTVKHVYKKPGTGYLETFPLIVRAADAPGQTAFLQLTTIVNAPGAGGASGKSEGGGGLTANLAVVWPMLIMLVFVIAAFWLGEWREKKIMERRLAALT